MANSWQFIPSGVLAEDKRQQAAEAWGNEQRTSLASDWAEEQRKLTEAWLYELGPALQPVPAVKKPLSMSSMLAPPQQSQWELPEQTEQTPPAPLGESLMAGLELAGRPQQALYGAYAAEPGAELEGARRGWEGQQQLRGADIIRSKGGLGNEFLNEAAGLATDVIFDPLNAVGLVGKLPGAIGKLAGAVPKLGEAAGGALRNLGEIAKSPELARLAPGLGIKDVSQSRRLFHGTGTAFEVPSPEKWDPNGLFGPGYYLTSNPEVAGSYAAQRGNFRPIAPMDIEAAQQRLQRYRDNLVYWQDPSTPSLSGYEPSYVKRMVDSISDSIRDTESFIASSKQGPNIRAVNIPQNLNLFDTTLPDVDATTIDRIASVLPQGRQSSFRVFTGNRRWQRPSRTVTGEDVYRELVETTDSKANANAALEKAGFDGLEYGGGRHMPLLDAQGQAIEHQAVVVFPAGLPKIRNAISGTAMGMPPGTIGAVAGGLTGATQGDTPEERARNALIYAAAGAAGAEGLAAAPRLAQNQAVRNVASRLHELAPLAGRALGDIGEMARSPEIARLAPGLGIKAVGENAPPFYSQLEQVVSAAKQPKALAGQWESFIKAQGVKAEETFWTGLDDFLKERSGKSVGKQEVLDWLEANKVDVEEVVKPSKFAKDYSNTKFQRFQLPGGENYRELLLTLPGKADLPLIERERYLSPHWDEPNALVHIRFNDRIGTDSKKTLFIEEVQSDWHQAGRKEGYREIGGVPPAPFSKTWPELALKRMVKWAADNGYERVAWTPGKVHADIPREGAKSWWGTERIAWTKRTDTEGGYFLLSVEPQVGGHAAGIDIQAEATARGLISKQDSVVVNSKDDIQRALDAAGGLEAPGSREIAENRTLADKLWNRMQAADEGIMMPRKEGMEGFYDVILPETMNKIAKKFGGRVGTSQIATDMGAGNLGATGVQSLDIPASMSKSAKEQGFPLFVNPETMGAVAGGATGYTTTPEGQDPMQRAAQGAMLGAGGVLGARGAKLAGVKAAKFAGTKLVENDIAWDRASNIIARMGQPGEQLSNRLKTWRNDAETAAGDWTHRLQTARSLNKAEFDNFVDVAQGKAQPTNARVQQAASEWDIVRNEVFQEAQAAGMDVNYRADYFPHRYDPKVIEEIYQSANAKGYTKWMRQLDNMVQSGVAKDHTEASAILYQIRDKIRIKKASNLELERVFNLPDYQRDVHAMLSYLSESADAISHAYQFGPKNEIANKLMAKAIDQGYDGEKLRTAFGMASGGTETSNRAVDIIRAANVFTKLGLGALTNAAQSVNTATVTGGMRTLLQTPKAMFSKEAKEFAIQAGVTLDSTIAKIREGGGVTSKLATVGAPGFNNVERFNRTLAVVAGRDMARTAARKGDVKVLQSLGLDPAAIQARGGRLTLAEEIKAGRNIVERTQFKVDPQDLAPWMSTPIGKLVIQFRTFSYNQSAFMWREVLQPAIKGDIKPLVRFLVYGAPVGAGLVEAQDFLRQRNPDETFQDQVLRYYQRIGGIGVLGELIAGLNPPGQDYASGERYAMQAVGLGLGPTAGSAVQGIAAIPPALGGKPEQLEKFALRQVPVAGSTLANVLVPRKEKAPASTAPRPGLRAPSLVPARPTLR